VEAVTTSWILVNQAQDDGTCEWHEPTYALRDGAGTVVDVGDLESEEGTAVGTVRESGDESECVLEATLDAPLADVYEVEVTTTAPASRTGGIHQRDYEGDQFSGSAMISRTDAADEALIVTVDGPSHTIY
jgi:hypothetical protein